jgi:hypothetical protein
MTVCENHKDYFMHETPIVEFLIKASQDGDIKAGLRLLEITKALISFKLSDMGKHMPIDVSYEWLSLVYERIMNHDCNAQHKESLYDIAIECAMVVGVL